MGLSSRMVDEHVIVVWRTPRGVFGVFRKMALAMPAPVISVIWNNPISLNNIRNIYGMYMEEHAW